MSEQSFDEFATKPVALLALLTLHAIASRGAATLFFRILINPATLLRISLLGDVGSSAEIGSERNHLRRGTALVCEHCLDRVLGSCLLSVCCIDRRVDDRGRGRCGARMDFRGRHDVGGQVDGTVNFLGHPCRAFFHSCDRRVRWCGCSRSSVETFVSVRLRSNCRSSSSVGSSRPVFLTSLLV
jgi:hypothetical protein